MPVLVYENLVFSCEFCEIFSKSYLKIVSERRRPYFSRIKWNSQWQQQNFQQIQWTLRK